MMTDAVGVLVRSVSYKSDDGRDVFAIVRSVENDGSLNLLWFDPDTSAVHAANQVPADRWS